MAREVVVRVLDEGPGVPEGMLEQVFEPFFRPRSRAAPIRVEPASDSASRATSPRGMGGSLVLRNRSPHGLEAVLRLPRAYTS